MKIHTVIKDCKIVTPEGIYPAGIAVAGEKIAAIARDEDMPQADKVIDAKGNYVIPGLIDAHCHLVAAPDELSTFIVKETQAYAFGGVTTPLHMLTAPTGLTKAIRDYIAVWEKTAYIDLGLTAEPTTKDNIGEIRGLLEELGIVGFKLQPCYRDVEPRPAPPGVPAIDEGIVYLTFEEIANLKKEGYKAHCRVHCEFIDIFLSLKDRAIKQGREPRSWHEIRPSFIEEEAMQRLIFLANLVGCPLYIVHMSIKEGVDMIAEARSKGSDVKAETCPQYLVLNVDNTDKVLSKINPPIRTKEDNKRLWEGLRDGIISVVGTDHYPMLKKDKLDLWTAAVGFSGAETLLPSMLSEGVNKGRISLENLVAVCCTNPAKIYGLFPKKGVIAVGSDADIVIIDLNKEATITDESAYSGADFNVYEGFSFKGWPVLTMLRGRIIMEQGKVIGKPGFGRYVPGTVR